MKRNPAPAEITASAFLVPLKGSEGICSACVEPQVSGKVVMGEERLGTLVLGMGTA